MPYRIAANSGGCAFAVLTNTGKRVGCHDTRSKAERHLAALYANVPDARKSLDDILDDAEFWNEQRAIMFKAIRPIFMAAFVAGAMAAKLEVAVAVKALDDPPPSFDLDAINMAAEKFIDSYTNDWWQKVERVTQDRLRETIKTARAEGKSVRWVSEQIVDLFGKDRAKGIAITEMTNLMGGGAQAQYKLDGFGRWEWRTSNDARVCPICEPRDGEQYPMAEQFQAAHPGCRCWPVPVGERHEIEPKPLPNYVDANGDLTIAPDNPEYTKAATALYSKLTEKERFWLTRYGGTFHEPLNKWLRAGRPADLSGIPVDVDPYLVNPTVKVFREAEAAIRSALAKAPPLSKEMVVYRGLARGYRGQLVEGRLRVRDAGIVSMSSDRAVAEEFGQQVARIVIPKGTRIAAINSREEEWVLMDVKFEMDVIIRPGVAIEYGMRVVK